jgi:transposase
MTEITRALMVRVGVDIAKQVIQVHAVDAAGRKLVSGAHGWARRLAAMGLKARLIAAHYVTPYRIQGKGGKNDANDAAAI